MMDLKSALQFVRVATPAAAGTTGTGRVGKIIDRKNHNGITLFAIQYGAVTATAATFTPVVKEGDTTGAMTSVADADLVGTEAAAALGAAVRASGTTMHVTKTVGYKGIKRYVSCNLVNTATAAAPVAILGIALPKSFPST
jgi:hypothetical protein